MPAQQLMRKAQTKSRIQILRERSSNRLRNSDFISQSIRAGAADSIGKLLEEACVEKTQLLMPKTRTTNTKEITQKISRIMSSKHRSNTNAFDMSIPEDISP